MEHDRTDEAARRIAAERGWVWDLMPSFADHFTRGCSHEECRAEARKREARHGKQS